MKYKGQVLMPPEPKPVVFDRTDGVEVVFMVGIVVDRTGFDKYAPQPLPPKVVRPGGKESENPDDPKYKLAIAKRNAQYVDWLILESLKSTPDLEWEKVKYDDPETWHLFREELKEAGFATQQVVYLINVILEENNVTEEKMEEARRRFLAGRLQNQAG